MLGYIQVLGCGSLRLLSETILKEGGSTDGRFNVGLVPFAGQPLRSRMGIVHVSSRPVFGECSQLEPQPRCSIVMQSNDCLHRFDAKALVCAWDDSAAISYSVFLIVMAVAFPLSLIAFSYFKVFR